jgi:PRC-barrel domain
MIDSNGTVTGAIIGVGGFLGVGQKDVVIPFKELKVSTRDGKEWLVLNRTKDELKLAPAYNNTGSPSARCSANDPDLQAAVTGICTEIHQSDSNMN